MKQLDPSLIPASPKKGHGRWSGNGRMPGLSRIAQGADLGELGHLATVIAFDPGGTTGWSLFSVDPDKLEGGVGKVGNVWNSIGSEEPIVDKKGFVHKWEHGQIDCGSRKGNLGTSFHQGISTDGENAGVNEMVGLIRAWPGAAVVIEDFILDPRRFNTSRDLVSPIRLTAAVSFILYLYRRQYFVQSAAMAKSTVTDVRLKAMGYYSSTCGPHARDADRHALTFLQRCKKSANLRRIAWPYLFGTEVKTQTR